MKLILIHIADMIDNYILHHTIYSFCNKVGNSKWWGNKSHNCWYCRKFGTDADWVDD